MGKSSSPSTPDYESLAKQDAASNLQAAKYATQANRPTQITPWGTSSWSRGTTFDSDAYNQAMQNYNDQLAAYNKQQSSQAPSGGVMSMKDYLTQSLGGSWAPVAPNKNDYYTNDNNWTQTVTLSPDMQALLGQQMGVQKGLFGAQDNALGRVNDAMSSNFDTSSLPAAGTAYDPTQATNNATDLIMQRINPQLDQQQEQLRARLANQGITQGSEAYNTAMTNFGQTRNDAQNQAALAGINLGMQQQDQTYNQQTNNRQNALSLESYLRELPLNELNALRQGNQVSQPQFPGFAQQATTSGPNLLGAANAQYQADLGNYNAQQAGNSSMLGGLFGIGGGLLQGAGAAGGFGKLFSW